MVIYELTCFISFLLCYSLTGLARLHLIIVGCLRCVILIQENDHTDTIRASSVLGGLGLVVLVFSIYTLWNHLIPSAHGK